MVNLIVKDIIGSQIAMATEAGDKVFNTIYSYLKQTTNVTLDFSNISILTTAFLNAALGQLYGEKTFTSEFLNEHLKIVNVQDEDKALFPIVIQRAKEYFKNREDFEDSANQVFYGSK